MVPEPHDQPISEMLDQLACRVEAGEAPEFTVEQSLFSVMYRELEVASHHTHAGEDVPADARARAVKKVVISGLRPVTSHQRVFNDYLLSTVTQLTNIVEESAQQNAMHDAQRNRLNASLATIDLALDELAGKTRELDERTRSLEQLQAQMSVLEARQNLIFRQARAALGDDAHVDTLREATRELSAGYEQLYEDLEYALRGSREAIRARLEDYLRDIRSIDSEAPVVDIGCGRGEWLEVLRDHKITSYGVDLNQLVVDRCVARELDARNEDALVVLRDLPEASVRAITAFQLAEHLPLDTLIALIEAALVALVPGGLLILETPNCTNINVGASSFYLDPTHLKPLHPQFLEFLTVQQGFLTSEVRFLNTEDGPHFATTDFAPTPGSETRVEEVVERVNWALFGPLDYVVLARKGPAA